MKTIQRIAFVAAACGFFVAGLFAAAPIKGPKEGRVLTSEAPHVELFVAKDRSVIVSFYDKDLKPVAPSGQVVSVVAEPPSGRVTLNFTVKDRVLVSTAPMPAGEGYRVVVQVRANAEARPVNYRFDYNEEICAVCKRAEYACICDE